MATGRVPTTANSPLTVKGDLFTFSTGSAKLAVGANDTALVADSTQSTGLAYKTKGVFNGLTTTGDTIYSSSGTTQARLGIGSTGQVLTVASGVPSWATPAGGMTLIGTPTTLTGASVTLSSIPGTYKILRLFIELPLNATDTWDTKMCFNGDTTANRHLNVAVTGGSAAFSQASAGITTDGLDNTVVQTLVDIQIPDYANALTWKMAYVTSIGNNSTTTTSVNTFTSVIAYNQTGAITSLLFKPGTGNFTSGTVYLYGVN